MPQYQLEYITSKIERAHRSGETEFGKSQELLPSSMTGASQKLSKVVSSKETPQSSFSNVFPSPYLPQKLSSGS